MNDLVRFHLMRGLWYALGVLVLTNIVWLFKFEGQWLMISNTGCNQQTIHLDNNNDSINDQSIEKHKGSDSNWNNIVNLLSQNTKPAQRIIIDYIEDIADDLRWTYKCDKIESKYEKILGLPYSTHITNVFHEYDALCFISTSGITADLTIDDKNYFYRFGHRVIGAEPTSKCWNQYPMINLDEYNINVTFVISGWGTEVFSHYMIFEVINFAFIYDTIITLSKHAIKNKQIINIAIITTLLNKTNSIQTWIWQQFEWKQTSSLTTSSSLLSPIVYMINDYTYLNLIGNPGGCGFGAKYTFYSSLMIHPYLINYKNNETDYKQLRTSEINTMYPRNSMLPIKKYLTNLGMKRDILMYLDRGDHFREKRSVKNNDEVIHFLENWCNNNNKLKFINFDGEFHTNNNFYNQTMYFSKTLIMIGPHGGKFGNLNFLQPNSYVIEFIDWTIPKGQLPTYFYALSQANGLHYYYLQPIYNSFNWSGTQMIVNVTMLNMLLDQVFEREQI